MTFGGNSNPSKLTVLVWVQASPVEGTDLRVKDAQDCSQLREGTGGRLNGTVSMSGSTAWGEDGSQRLWDDHGWTDSVKLSRPWLDCPAG